MQSHLETRRHVVIVGGGFAGLEAARALRRANVDVTVIDRTNHHLFQPLLYQVATAALAPSDIAEPLRSLLARHDNATVRLAEVTSIDLEGKTLSLVDEGGERAQLAWDSLVIAAGARFTYFGNEAWRSHAPGLKSIGDALEIRRKILSAFERAEHTDDPAEREALMTFVVVGAGPTGVELAGAIAEIAFHTLRDEYRNIDTADARVILLEGADAVLPPYPDSLQTSAKRQLESLSVDVRLGAMVTEVTDDGVRVGDEGVFIPSRTVLWGAGMEASPLTRGLGAPTDRAGKVKVEPDLSIPGHPDAFAVGDLVSLDDPKTGEPVPGVAPAAMQMGRFVGKTIRRDQLGIPRRPFHYVDRGLLATIGRRRAVADTYGLRFGGFPAWLAWVGVHIFFLVTLRNRALVMTKWAWAWATWERATRLVWRPAPGPEAEEAVETEKISAS